MTSRDTSRSGSTRSGGAPLSIRLLGGFGIWTPSGAALQLAGQRQRTLVAYLVLHRDAPSDRRHLAFLLWPDSTEAQALTNLRQLIHDVRAVLPEPDRFLEAGRQLVRWRADARIRLDVADLDAAVGMAGVDADGSVNAVAVLADAIALYRGDLLPECYDEWIEPHRRRSRQTLAAALRQLVRLLEHRRDYGAAIPYAERLRELDPVDESSTLTLMRLHAVDGQRAGALYTFRRFAEFLQRELGVAPGRELRELHDRLLAIPDAEVPRSAVHPAPVQLVGRTAEWERLTRAWSATKGGDQRGVIVSGDAGIGKTCLAQEFLRWAERQGATTAVARCYGTAGRLPYGPILDWLRAPPLDRAASSLPDAWRAEIARLRPELDTAQVTAAPRERDDYPTSRRRLFDALVRTLVAAPHPLLLLIDDLQWVDQETLDWIAYLLHTSVRVPALLLATRRSGEATTADRLDAVLHELDHAGRMGEVALLPLDLAATAALGGATAGTTLGARAARELFRETEGHPLFIVETIRARGDAPHDIEGARGADTWTDAESTVRAASHSAVVRPLPQRMLAVIRARLGQLSRPARSAIGAASVVGREFTLPLLAGTARLDELEAASALDELIERRLVCEQGDGSYNFTHDRLRQVAYQDLGPARRQLLHRRIARAQIARAAGPIAAASATARHLEKSGLIDGAVPYYRLAAEHALEVHAGAEAVLHLDRAIGLLARLPATPARRAQEIELRAGLCVALVNVEMFSGERMLEEYARVCNLCDQAGLAPGPPVLRTLAIALVMKGEVAAAADIGQRLLAMVPAAGNPVLRVEAHYTIGVTAFWQAEFAGACEHLGAAMTAYRPERAREHVATYGQDAGAVCGVRLAQALWMVGRPDEGRRVLSEAIARAEALAHPHTLAYTLQFGSMVLIGLGDEDDARRLIEGAVEVAEANGLSGWPMMNEALAGYLRARAGEVSRGIEMMRHAAELWAGRGWRLAVPYHRALLAEVCLAADRLDEARDALDEGAAVARTTGQVFWDADLLRLRAELLAATGASPALVGRELRAARGVAVRQGARALEQRVEWSRRRLGAPGGG